MLMHYAIKMHETGKETIDGFVKLGFGLKYSFPPLYHLIDLNSKSKVITEITESFGFFPSRC